MISDEGQRKLQQATALSAVAFVALLAASALVSSALRLGEDSKTSLWASFTKLL